MMNGSHNSAHNARIIKRVVGFALVLGGFSLIVGIKIVILVLAIIVGLILILTSI